MLVFQIFVVVETLHCKLAALEIFAKLNENGLALANILQFHKYQAKFLVNMLNMSYVLTRF